MPLEELIIKKRQERKENLKNKHLDFKNRNLCIMFLIFYLKYQENSHHIPRKYNKKKILN